MKHLVFFVNIVPFFLSHRLALGLHAKSLGYRVSVIALPHVDKKKLADHGINFYPLSMSRDRMNPFLDLNTLFCAFRLLKKLKPDILHLVTIKPIIYGGIAARLLNIPAVFAVTGLGCLFYQKGLMRVFRWVIRPVYNWIGGHKRSVFIFQNSDDQAFIKRFCKLRETQLFLIRGAGVDIHQIPYEPLAVGKPCVVMISRLVKSKGVLLFLKAAQALHTQYRFVLCGGIDQQSKDAIGEDGLNDYIKSGVIDWLGHVDDIRLVLKKAHIVCLPTLGGEGLPKVLLEAASTGRAIVASDVPGCREIVKAGHNGYLFNQADVSSFIRCIEKIATNSDKQLTMGKNGRAMVEKDFSLEKVIADTFLVYAHVLSQR